MWSQSQRVLYVLPLLFALVVAISERGQSSQMDYGINQVPYARGQNVVPTFEGWERNPDGTFNMVFGYLNRNYEEELDIPIGPDNNVEPGAPDQGQPTFFGTRRHPFQFRVKVPKDWGPTKRVVWTLTIRGRTEKANGFLLPEWELNDQVIAGRFAAGGGAPDIGDNKAPDITVSADTTITLPNTATLTASVSDDGLPKPRTPRPPAGGAAGARAAGTPVTGGAAAGARAASSPGAVVQAAGSVAPAGPPLRVEWVTWRRPVGGTVTFKPAASPVIGGKVTTTSKAEPVADGTAATTSKPEPVTNGKAVTTVSFGAPGKYVLKGFAIDGAVTTPSADVIVTVNLASSTERP